MIFESVSLADISTVVAILVSISAVIFAWKKSKSERQSSEADAAETALKSTQLATEQLIKVQIALADERAKRIEQDKKIEHLEKEIGNAMTRIKRLEAQVVSLGADPVK